MASESLRLQERINQIGGEENGKGEPEPVFESHRSLSDPLAESDIRPREREEGESRENEDQVPHDACVRCRDRASLVAVSRSQLGSSYRAICRTIGTHGVQPARNRPSLAFTQGGRTFTRLTPSA